MLARFPEVKQIVSQVGRPDDGSDASGFYNTEFFVDLLPRSEWRSEFKTKDDLIAAMDKELDKFPGCGLEFFPAHFRQRGRSRERREGRTGGQAVRH